MPWSADDEADQAATADAFAVLHFIAAQRLAAGRLTVMDATNVQPRQTESRSIALARQYHSIPVAIVSGHAGAAVPRAQTSLGPIATSARTSFGNSPSSCGVGCAA